MTYRKSRDICLFRLFAFSCEILFYISQKNHLLREDIGIVRSFSAQVPVFEENGYFSLFSEKVIFLGNVKKARYNNTCLFCMLLVIWVLVYFPFWYCAF